MRKVSNYEASSRIFSGSSSRFFSGSTGTNPFLWGSQAGEGGRTAKVSGHEASIKERFKGKKVFGFSHLGDDHEQRKAVLAQMNPLEAQRIERDIIAAQAGSVEGAMAQEASFNKNWAKKGSEWNPLIDDQYQSEMARINQQYPPETSRYRLDAPASLSPRAETPLTPPGSSDKGKHRAVEEPPAPSSQESEATTAAAAHPMRETSPWLSPEQAKQLRAENRRVIQGPDSKIHDVTDGGRTDTEFARQFNLPRGNLSNVLTDSKERVKGFHLPEGIDPYPSAKASLRTGVYDHPAGHELSYDYKREMDRRVYERANKVRNYFRERKGISVPVNYSAQGEKRKQFKSASAVLGKVQQLAREQGKDLSYLTPESVLRKAERYAKDSRNYVSSDEEAETTR